MQFIVKWIIIYVKFEINYKLLSNKISFSYEKMYIMGTYIYYVHVTNELI